MYNQQEAGQFNDYTLDLTRAHKFPSQLLAPLFNEVDPSAALLDLLQGLLDLGGQLLVVRPGGLQLGSRLLRPTLHANNTRGGNF